MLLYFIYYIIILYIIILNITLELLCEFTFVAPVSLVKFYRIVKYQHH